MIAQPRTQRLQVSSKGSDRGGTPWWGCADRGAGGDSSPVGMSENGEQRESLMEASGMGLLPGIMVALAIVMGGMALLLLGHWWALTAALLVLIAAAAAITIVVMALTGEGRRTKACAGGSPASGRRAYGGVAWRLRGLTARLRLPARLDGVDRTGTRREQV
jgi:hypothetical protein